MMMAQEVTYRPQPGADGVPKDSNMYAVVTIGFVKDAKAHIDVQGFNVYHKNRLIKPFWRLWHAPGSDGRGVIGVLEANFVEPAHDKQGFERTTVLSRLEAKLVQMQKTYWSSQCHKIGYAPRRKKSFEGKDGSADYPSPSSLPNKKSAVKSADKSHINGTASKGDINPRSRFRQSYSERSSSAEDASDDDNPTVISKENNKGHSGNSLSARRNAKTASQTAPSPGGSAQRGTRHLSSRGREVRDSIEAEVRNGDEADASNLNSSSALDQLKEENRLLRERLNRKEEEILGDLLLDLQQEREKCKSLEAQLQKAAHKIDELNKEQESLIDVFSAERQQRDTEEENLRKKLKDASNTIQELLDKVRMLEKLKPMKGK